MKFLILGLLGILFTILHPEVLKADDGETADPEAFLKEVVTLYQSVADCHASVTYTLKYPDWEKGHGLRSEVQQGIVAYRKPGDFRLSLSPPFYEWISLGENLWFHQITTSVSGEEVHTYVDYSWLKDKFKKQVVKDPLLQMILEPERFFEHILYGETPDDFKWEMISMDEDTVRIKISGARQTYGRRVAQADVLLVKEDIVSHVDIKKKSLHVVEVSITRSMLGEPIEVHLWRYEDVKINKGISEGLLDVEPPENMRSDKSLSYLPSTLAEKVLEDELVGNSAADFSIKDEEGTTLRLSDFRGKVLLLYFIFPEQAFWLHPDRYWVGEIWQKFSSQDFQVVGVIDTTWSRAGDEENIKNVFMVASERGIDHVFRMADETLPPMYTRMNVRPAVFIIDKDMVVRRVCFHEPPHVIHEITLLIENLLQP